MYKVKLFPEVWEIQTYINDVYQLHLETNLELIDELESLVNQAQLLSGVGVIYDFSENQLHYYQNGLYIYKLHFVQAEALLSRYTSRYGADTIKRKVRIKKSVYHFSRADYNKLRFYLRRFSSEHGISRVIEWLKKDIERVKRRQAFLES